MSRTLLRRPGLRLTAGTLALALPLVAAAGCGLEKKKTIKQEFQTASDYLAKSDAVSFTLRLEDAKGSLAKVATKHDMPAAMQQALLKGSVTMTMDVKTAFALQQQTCAPGKPFDFASVFSKETFSIAVSDDKAPLAELRFVHGDLYAFVGLHEISRLATAGGVPDFDQKLDETIGAPGSPFVRGLADVRAGKWLKLPLSKYLTQLQQASEAMQSNLGASGDLCKAANGYKNLQPKLVAALKPFVKITDANDSSSNRVLDVNVKVRPAIKAAFDALRSAKDLPFGKLFADVTPADIDSHVKDGTAHGTITLKDSHLTQFTVDVEPLRLLSTDPGTDTAEGVRVIVDVDDSAPAIVVPGNVSSVDIAQLFEGVLGSVLMRAGEVKSEVSSQQMTFTPSP